MANDYTWLQAKITRWIRRTDLAADIPDFIMLAEKRISGDLVARMQNVVSTLTTAAGVQTVDLPDDLNSIISVSIPTYGKVTLMTPEKLADAYSAGSRGVPRHYAIVGVLLRLGPVPDGVYQMDFVYHAEVPALASSLTGTNWLLTSHPEVYLAGAMCEAFTFVRDTANLQVWEAKYQDAVLSLDKTDWNSGGTLSVRTDTTTP